VVAPRRQPVDEHALAGLEQRMEHDAERGRPDEVERPFPRVGG
jgi:hypothetical protein